MSILFRRATVVDGTGEPRYTADVLVDDGVLRSIGAATTADRIVESEGLVLSPGFIDMHAHSDLALFTAPDHLAKLTQGVTTELLGQDGLGYAPTDDATLAQLRRQIAGWNGNPSDFDFSWRSRGGYLDRLDRGIATNAAVLVPQGNLRLMTVGSADRAATAQELDAMRGILRDALAEGAVGMSSGLSYVPGMFADTAELTALCEVVAERGGFWAPHTRSYGLGALEGYAEAIGIARRSGCALHLTHAKMNFEVNRGRASELLALIDDALADGIDITLDSYPYLAGSTTLGSLLPSWASVGSIEDVVARLKDPSTRERIRVALEETGSDGCSGLTVDWTTIQIAGVTNPELGSMVGSMIAELAASAGVPPIDVAVDLLIRDGLATSILQHVGDEDNLRLIMRHPAHTGGSDGILVGDRPHPRAWGTFPRFIGRYSRELELLSLEECVSHLTGRAAARLRLDRRGLIREGYAADLVLFDPETILDRATYEQPRLAAVGIHSVLVNGVFAIDGGKPTGSRSGRALRSAAGVTA